MNEIVTSRVYKNVYSVYYRLEQKLQYEMLQCSY